MMRVASRLTTATVLAGFLLAQIVPAAAFAQAAKPQPTVAQPSRVQVAPAQMLRALLQFVGKNATFSAPRRGAGTVAAQPDAQLSEADADKAMQFTMNALVGALGALTSSFAVTANELANVSSELSAANFNTPVVEAKKVIALAVPQLITGFTQNMFRGIAAALPLMHTTGALSMAAPETLPVPNFLTRAIAATAYAADPIPASWAYMKARAVRLVAVLRSDVKSPIERGFNTDAARAVTPDIRTSILQYIADIDVALNAAVRAANAEDGAATVRALEAVGDKLRALMIVGRTVDGEFRNAVIEFVGITAYNAVAMLMTYVVDATAIARILESQQMPKTTLQDILSDPRVTIRRGEQIGAEETAKKIRELLKMFEGVKAEIRSRAAQLKIHPNDKSEDPEFMRLNVRHDELAGAIKALERIQRALPFALKEIKEPVLSCDSVNRESMLRKIKVFSVREDVIPLLRAHAGKMLKEAEDAARKYYNEETMIPEKSYNTLINNALRGAEHVYQSDDRSEGYGDDVYPYRKKVGRLRWDAKGIFGLGYGAVQGRIQQIAMVGLYMAEDALERFAADCTKPPSVIADEMIKKYSKYIDNTSFFSEAGADKKLREELEKLVEKYKEGLGGLLRDLDVGIYGGLRAILDNLGVINSNWTATYPDVTALLAAIKSSLAALQALGLNTAAWADLAEGAATKKISGGTGGAPPKDETLTIKCPTDSQPPRTQPPESQPSAECRSGNLFTCSLQGAEGQLWAKNPFVGPGFHESGYFNSYSFEACANYDYRAQNFQNDQGSYNMLSPEFKDRVNSDPCSYACGDAGPPAISPMQVVGTPAVRCGWTGESTPGAQIPATQGQNIIELMRKCVSRTSDEKVPLAEVWEETRKYIKALVLERLQFQMDGLPYLLNSLVKDLVRDELGKQLMKRIEEVLESKGDDLILGTKEEQIRGYVTAYGEKINKVSKLTLDRNDFPRYWSPISGPNVRAYNDPNASPEKVAKYVFDIIYTNVGNILGQNVHPEIIREAAGMGAIITAFAYNVTKNFDKNWGTEDIDPDRSPNHPASLRGVFASSVTRTLNDLIQGVIIPDISGYVVRTDWSDLHKKVETLLSPTKSPLPLIKNLYAATIAIDRIVKELQDLSKKNIELQTTITACADGIGTGERIAKILMALGNVLEQAENGSLARRAGEEAKNVAEGIEVSVEVGGESPPKTVLGESLAAILEATEARLAREAAAALKQQSAGTTR